MWTSERLAVIGSATSVVLSLFALVLGPGPVMAIPLLVGGLAIGWRLVPGFWSTIRSGSAGGIVAGVVVLGSGLRLAMRLVAILDPVRTPEFTWEGTFFIIGFVGGVSGVLLGVVTALLRLVITARATVTLVVVAFMGILFGLEDIRTEFMELGAGPWINIPLFTAVATGFAFVMFRLIDRFERARIKHTSTLARVQA